MTLLQKYSRDWQDSEAKRLVFSTFTKYWTPPPKMSISDWADTNRRLSSESSAEVGQWDTARAEYQRGMMDAISDITVSEVTIESSSQIGKTEIINNTVGFHIDRDPAPMMLVQPTLDLAEIWSENRLTPMLRDTPCLKDTVSDSKSRSVKNTKLHKVFTGGHLIIGGSNSPASLASHPIRILLLDEIDRYPYSAGKEGDPVKLATKRTTTFWNKKIIKVSTPTIKGDSRIEKSFEESDQRYFWVPCPFCEKMQILRWEYVKWENDDPETAMYQCKHCDELWDDVDRWRAVSRGQWKAKKEFKGHAGFWIWEAYSPWVTLAKMVTDFLEAKRQGPEELKVFVNTSLAESWEDMGERVDDAVLLNRREDYTAAPSGVAVITAAVDVQADRLELELVGWGLNNQSWGLGITRIWGPPKDEDVWEKLDEILQTPVPHELFGEMKIKAVGVDTGYLPQNAGMFCRPRKSRQVWPFKGMPGPGRPLFRQSPHKMKDVSLTFFQIGVDTAKEIIYSNLRVDKSDAGGYCHFNMSYDADHFAQLTSEEAVTSYTRGRKVRQWKLKKGQERNEALDLRVYNLAALAGLRLYRGFSVHKTYLNLLRRHNINIEDIQKKQAEKTAEIVKSIVAPGHGSTPATDPVPEPTAKNPAGSLVAKKTKKKRIISMF